MDRLAAYAWRLIAPLATVLFLIGCGASGPKPAKIPREKWDTVAKGLTEKGDGMVSVGPYDTEYPDHMVITLRGGLSRAATDYDMRAIANSTLSKLGVDAFVYVYDDTGKLRATATKFGTSN